MRRLFIDVDNTLIHWLPSDQFGIPDTDWEVNGHVVDFALWWQSAFPDGVLTVRSSNGKDYAKEWAERVIPEGTRYVVSDKKAFKATLNDTFVDDSPWPSFYGGEVTHPDDLKANA